MIAPSKLGFLVARYSDDTLVTKLREKGLVREDVSDYDLQATFRQAEEEHVALPLGQREFNSPNERVRVFLEPFLTHKGKLWAEPLRSLELPDDDV